MEPPAVAKEAIDCKMAVIVMVLPSIAIFVIYFMHLLLVIF
jgi:hypothetical protein